MREIVQLSTENLTLLSYPSETLVLTRIVVGLIPTAPVFLGNQFNEYWFYISILFSIVKKKKKKLHRKIIQAKKNVGKAVSSCEPSSLKWGFVYQNEKVLKKYTLGFVGDSVKCFRHFSWKNKCHIVAPLVICGDKDKALNPTLDFHKHAWCASNSVLD